MTYFLTFEYIKECNELVVNDDDSEKMYLHCEWGILVEALI